MRCCYRVVTIMCCSLPLECCCCCPLFPLLLAWLLFCAPQLPSCWNEVPTCINWSLNCTMCCKNYPTVKKTNPISDAIVTISTLVPILGVVTTQIRSLGNNLRNWLWGPFSAATIHVQCLIKYHCSLVLQLYSVQHWRSTTTYAVALT